MAGNKQFGDRIRELRMAKLKADPTFTLRQFATAVGISATFLSKVERGDFDPPAAKKIQRMAELLGVDADELLALAGRVDPELNDIIMENSAVLPDLLRTVRGMSVEDVRRLMDDAKNRRGE